MSSKIEDWTLVYRRNQLGPVEATFTNNKHPHFMVDIGGTFDICEVTLLYRESVITTVSGDHLPDILAHDIETKIQKYSGYASKIDWINHTCKSCGNAFLKESIRNLLLHAKECSPFIKSANKT